MDRQQFYFLYANLNSIAELGLREAVIDALAEPVAEPAVENLSQDEPTPPRNGCASAWMNTTDVSMLSR
jgi:hypothetical protein